MFSAKEVDHYWGTDGSIHSLKSIHPDQIKDDPELAFFWGLAKNRLAEFEKAEDEIVRVLEHRYSKGWRP